MSRRHRKERDLIDSLDASLAGVLPLGQDYLSVLDRQYAGGLTDQLPNFPTDAARRRVDVVEEEGEEYRIP